MRTRHLFTAAALTAAALTLTACGPDETPGAASSPTAAASGPAAPSASGAASGAASAKPSASAKASGSAKPSAAKSSTAKPTADCTANAASVGKVIEATEVGYATHVWMKAKDAKFICGPDIPDDGYFEGYGDVKLYSFSNDVKTSIISGSSQQPLALNDFMKHADTCLTNPSAVQGPQGCFGNKFVVTVNSSNVITSIAQLYHP